MLGIDKIVHNTRTLDILLIVWTSRDGRPSTAVHTILLLHRETVDDVEVIETPVLRFTCLRCADDHRTIHVAS